MKSLIFFLGFGLLYSCNSGGGGGSSPAPKASSSATTSSNDISKKASDNKASSVTIFPSKLFTGFDTNHTFKAPASLIGAKKGTWTADDPSLVTITPADGGAHVTFTAKKAGTTDITVTSGSDSATVTLIISAYTAAQWAAGEQRYKNTSATSGAACISCHTGKGDSAPDHTPTEIDAFTDAEIINTFLTGINPEGQPVPAPAPHKFPVSLDEKSGLVSYLRALVPSGYPDPNN